MHAEDVLFYGNRTVMATLDGVAESEWEAPGAVGVWTVKNVAAHLASHEWKLVDALLRLLGEPENGTLARSLNDPQGFNDREVAARAGFSPEETVEEYRRAHAQAAELVRRIPAERRREAGAIPWYGAEYDLEDYIAYGVYEHKREHIAQVAAFLERLRNGELTKS